nr:hypothetical protein Iba_chr01cCG12660 [Ipomoea batatas]GMC54090.1 hypothetical protein Iba_chr01dCG12860 [Ipomoea batatas]
MINHRLNFFLPNQGLLNVESCHLEQVVLLFLVVNRQDIDHLQRMSLQASVLNSTIAIYEKCLDWDHIVLRFPLVVSEQSSL